MTNPTGSILLRRGPTTDRLGFTPLIGEIIYDTTQNKVYVGDAATVGGIGSVQADFPNPGVMIKGLTAESFLVAPGQTASGDPHIQYLSFDKSSGQYVFTSISASGSALTSITLDSGTGISVKRTDVSPNVTDPTITTTGTISVTLNPATTSVLGGVIADGSTIAVDNTGKINVVIATASARGAVIPDGSIITVDNTGKISVATATSNALGVVKADGTTINVDNNGKLSIPLISATKIFVGSHAGATSQADNTIAVGVYAGQTSQNQYGVALGYYAGQSGQLTSAVAIGQYAGQVDQGVSAVAIGANAGTNTQHQYAVAIGTNAGGTGQGNNAIAIGYNAGTINQVAGSIIINATGNVLNAATNVGFHVAPIRNDTGNVTNALFWNNSTNEITYGPALPSQDISLNGYFLKTNGTSASWASLGAASANTNSAIVARDSSGNFSAGTITATLSGTATGLASGATILSVLERATITPSYPSATINFDVSTQSIQYYTSSTQNSFVVNLRGNSTTTLNSFMVSGQSMTFALLVNCANVAHYATGLTIDGNAISNANGYVFTVKWQGGIQPAAGDSSSTDVYTGNVIKTADKTFTVLASLTKFA